MAATNVLGQHLGRSMLLLSLALAACSDATPSPATAAPVVPTLATALPTTASVAPTTTTSAPTSGGTSDISTKFDLIFSTFLEETDERNNVLRVLQNALGVPDGRITYDESSEDKKGFLYGFNVIVRFVISPSTSANQNASHAVRDNLNALWRSTGGTVDDPRLANIGVVDVYNVPDGGSVPKFQVRTSWDLLWTLVIVAGGILFFGFLGFVGFRIVVKVRKSADDARVEAKVKADKEKAAATLPRDPAGSTAGGGGTSVAAQPSGGSVRPWELPDDEELTLVNQLAANTGPSILQVPQVSEELIRQKVMREQEQVLAEFDLPPESAAKPELDFLLRPARGQTAASNSRQAPASKAPGHRLNAGPMTLEDLL